MTETSSGVGEGLEGGGGSVPAVGEPELDVAGEPCDLVIVLGLLHHRNEGRPVRGVVVRFDGQQELTAGAHDLDVVSLQVAAAFAGNQPGVGIAQAGTGLRGGGRSGCGPAPARPASSPVAFAGERGRSFAPSGRAAVRSLHDVLPPGPLGRGVRTSSASPGEPRSRRPGASPRGPPSARRLRP